MKEKEIGTILVPAGQKPVKIRCTPSPEGFADVLRTVRVEVAYRFSDGVVLICRNRKDAQDLTYNRALLAGGKLVDIVVGDFLLVYDPQFKNEFMDIEEDVFLEYYASFYYPETFEFQDEKIIVYKYDYMYDTIWTHECYR